MVEWKFYHMTHAMNLSHITSNSFPYVYRHNKKKSNNRKKKDQVTVKWKRMTKPKMTAKNIIIDYM